MKYLIRITASALLFGAMMVSCNGSSSYNAPDYSEEAASVSSSGGNNDESQYEKRTISNNASNKTGNEDLQSLCNTKWEFTDARGRKFVLKITDFSKTGKSVKAELFKDGEHNANGTISLDWRDPLYEFDFPTETGKDKAYIYYPDDSSWLEFACWDYENGYIYKSSSAWEAEDSSLRLKIKKIK